jgi:putative SOS response-associated peptidase YedK
MCARYTIRTPADLLAARFGLPQIPDLRPRYNVSPTELVPVIGAKPDGRRGLAMLKWGFIPHWTNNAKGPRPVNAKAETVAQSVIFGESLRKRRCILPVDGFYEWRTINKKEMPVWFHLIDNALFGFPGIWDVWPGPDGKVFTCANRTTTPNELTRQAHDRMSVILKPEAEGVWLDPTVDDSAKVMLVV